ncbi:serine hydrolase domain-containing protein [Pseudonocardia sp. CA-107938]|uniref:serine hydrolase domain-containing protein n=1 Tax=Pseudonocardia sp. CA-107938 TaxID=3240021 RepID=UPI003D89ED7D
MSVTEQPTSLDPAPLQSAIADLHRAGVPGVCADVRRAGRTWTGAAGVADRDTGRPMTTDLRHRVGSITKTFTAAAVLRQVERGAVGLDDPIGRYLPRLVPGERGAAVTVRMLLNHTSGIPDYLPFAFPSIRTLSPESLDENRFRRFHPTELIGMGLAAPAGTPGVTPGAYSNSGYLLLGELLTALTGASPAACIAEVAARAGLTHTALPDGPAIDGPYPAMYEALYGLIDPPRDYSVYDASWIGTGAGMVSTVADLTRFFAALLDGAVVDRSSLQEMQRTVPVTSFEGKQIEYGLGLHRHVLPGCGTLWGHDGTVWGALAMAWISDDGARQLSFAVNLVRWASAGPDHPIDAALGRLHQVALHEDAP